MKYKLAALVGVAALLPTKALAVVTVNVPDSVKGPSVNELISRVTNILSLIAGSAAVIALVIGGILYITSAGDERKVEAAKNTILYAVIGLIIALLAYAISAFVISGLQTGTPK